MTEEVCCFQVKLLSTFTPISLNVVVCSILEFLIKMLSFRFSVRCLLPITMTFDLEGLTIRPFLSNHSTVSLT